MRRLLSSKGCIYLHCDANASHYIKIMMDEVFGNDNFRNEIVVRRIRKNVRERTRVPRLNVGFDSILFYSKTNEHLIIPSLKEDPKPERWHSLDAPGVRNGMDYELFGVKPPSSRHWMWEKDKANEAIKNGTLRPNKNTGKPEYFIAQSTHILRDNFWDDITAYSFNYNYPTEKKEDMLQLIIEASSTQKDIVADFFCGSGTTAAVAEKLGRRWITTDLSKTAIQVTRARLVNQNAAAFLIQNLGNYQRQLIYMRDVKLSEMYNIILKLYGAAPREDMQGFGVKQDDKSTLVFVCEPDRPMTGRKAIDLAKQAHLADGKGYRRLVILAWDYELDFDNDFSRLKANKKEIADCEFKVIPSDVLKYLRKTGVNGGSLADKITFYQKPYLRMGEPNVRQRDGDTVEVQIKVEQYVILDIPLKDEEKRPEIEKMLAKNFAVLIDYWTVDWDYNGEVFRSTWQAMRDRKKGEPVPIVADSSLKKGKKYTIAVRVVDVFGNDASVTKELDLR